MLEKLFKKQSENKYQCTFCGKRYYWYEGHQNCSILWRYETEEKEHIVASYPFICNQCYVKEMKDARERLQAE